MDRGQFDVLGRLVAGKHSRRAALATALGVPLLGRNPDLGQAKGKKGKKGKGDKSERPCFPGGPCIAGPGKKLAGCDLTSTYQLHQRSAQGAHLAGANLTTAHLIGADLRGADLGGACLVGADLRTARVDGSTKLKGATFCGTFMPNGSVDNSGCERPTRCCPTDLTGLPGWGNATPNFSVIANGSQDHTYSVDAWWFPVGSVNPIWHLAEEGHSLPPGGTWHFREPYRKLALWFDKRYWVFVFNALVFDPLGQIGFGGQMKANDEGWSGNWTLVKSSGMVEGQVVSQDGFPVVLTRAADGFGFINFFVNIS